MSEPGLKPTRERFGDRIQMDGLGERVHEHLIAVVPRHPMDYQDFGFVDRQDPYLPDCSCGCRWYLTLAGELGADWGVCANPRSHRCGLLTFEHQGCHHFMSGASPTDPDTDERG